MPDLNFHLVHFIFCLSFGMAASMAWTSPKLVTSGFFQKHLWVIMGFLVLAALTSASQVNLRFEFWLSVGAGFLSYVGSIIWLYEKHSLGRSCLVVLAVLMLMGTFATVNWQLPFLEHTLSNLLMIVSTIASGMLLGTVITAMFLGHWYLNTPTMQLDPLKQLIAGIGISLVLRVGCSVASLGLILLAPIEENFQWGMLAARWGIGFLALAIATAATWYTLKIPNTQSATGILYAGVIVAFLGELLGQLLSVDLPYLL